MSISYSGLWPIFPLLVFQVKELIMPLPPGNRRVIFLSAWFGPVQQPLMSVASMLRMHHGTMVASGPRLFLLLGCCASFSGLVILHGSVRPATMAKLTTGLGFLWKTNSTIFQLLQTIRQNCFIRFTPRSLLVLIIINTREENISSYIVVYYVAPDTFLYLFFQTRYVLHSSIIIFLCQSLNLLAGWTVPSASVVMWFAAI